jgi:hypothetical protein
MDYKKATQSEIGLEVNLEVFNFVPKNQDVGMFTMLKKSAPGEIRTHGPRIRNCGLGSLRLARISSKGR